MEHLQAYNKKLLSNILPVHVAEYFMSGDKNNDVRTLIYKYLGLLDVSCLNCHKKLMLTKLCLLKILDMDLFM